MDVLDKLYTDFTTSFLPAIAKGLTITRDYFFDLFGRYVKFLVIQDSIWVVVSLMILTLGIAVLVLGNVRGRQKDWEDGFWIVQLLAGGVCAIWGFMMTIEHSFDLAKDLTIPEIRVYEELTELMKYHSVSNNTVESK